MAEKLETFGSSIPALAGNQLKVREELYSKSSKNLQNIQTINSNTAWVVLRSSVDEVTNKSIIDDVARGKKSHDDFTTENTTAKDFILTGGRAAEFFNKSVKGVNLFGDYNALNTYNKDNRLGVRPMPGITGLKVASKNTYGTLMQAEVEFSVWSLDDLQRAELLYFRPGYSALLEWGHSVYVGDSVDDIEYAGKNSIIYPDDGFFTGKTMVEIDKQVNKKRTDSKGNYDGMFGYITNFSWSFRPDGGYDCSIKIVSRGVVLESISVGKTSDMTEAEKKKQEEEKEARKSKFHFIFNRLEGNTDDNTFNAKEYLASDEGKAADAVSNLTPFDVFRINQDLAGEGLFGVFDKGINLIYMPLRAVIDIINYHFNLKDPKKNQDLLTIDLNFGEKYVTFPQHMSVDPLVAVLPKTPNFKAYPEYLEDGSEKDFTILLGEVTKNMEAYASSDKYTSDSRASTDDIMNIMVTSIFVKKCISKVIDGPQEEGAGVQDFLDELFSGINNAFGEINDIGLFYDHYECIYKVVDRRNTGTGSGTFAKLQELQITGLSSTVVDIGLSSKISSQISSQVSIAAQGNSGNYKDNVEAILKWNSGAVDRHIPIKTVDPAPGRLSTKELEEQAKKRRKTYIEDLREVWYKFNNAEVGEDKRGWLAKAADQLITNQSFDSEAWNQLRQESITEMNRFYKKERKTPVPQGVVPVELSLKLVGITGFKIGTAFKIKPGLLPSKYDKFAYIITGLDHEIGTDNKWYTNIKTQFYAVQ